MSEDLKVKETILLVDDNPINLQVLFETFKESGYKLIAAKDGEKALAMAESAHPDLILLDIMMPGMDGYEVCRHLKADEGTSNIPIIFVTAMGEAADETKGLELGAVDYITKPFSPPIVQARVRTHLALKRNMVELQEAYKIIESQKERMEDELNVGREIQMNMVPLTFPPFPDRDEFSIYATLQPAREVGGDFYDFFFIDEYRLCFCIGDVSGKGVPAALFMAVTKTLIEARARNDLSTASIITHVNDELSRDNKAFMFVTLFLGILDVRTGEFLYTNGGHNPPYIKRKNGSIDILDARHGPIVGPVPGLTYKAATARLAPDDLIFLFTDGVNEAMDPSKNQFSDERLVDLLSSRVFESVEEMVQTTVDEVKQFAGEAEQSDDITLLAIQFLKAAEADTCFLLDIPIKNSVPAIGQVNSRFNALSKQHGLSDPLRRKMNVVFDELLSNIISYAYQDDQEHEIEIKIELTEEKLTVSIVDDGLPFNPLGVEAPNREIPMEERKVGGLGIHLVRSIMDKVSYQRRIDKNVLTLIKHLDNDTMQL
ncbi:MAG: SpoIIE family protein phosphatase [Deltaproteobacteria bacterium]|nr:SpoIIE family protein phosphatase [Deltaproteobacteria bacterium]